MVPSERGRPTREAWWALRKAAATEGGVTVADKDELLTVAKLAEAWGLPKAALGRRIKEASVKPDLVKAGCSFYSLPRMEKLRKKLRV